MAGPDSLSRTCKMYPRHIEEYEADRDNTLSLSCPEAARLLLEHDAPLTLTLYPTPDVAAAVGAKTREGQLIVAFAAETQNLLENARKKLGRKNASLVVANDVTRAGAGCGTDTNVAACVTAQGVRELPMMTKRELADKILDEYVSGKNS